MAHPTDDANIESGAEALKTTPLTESHKAAGARMVPFAGYLMPLQYAGIVAEHKATRESAGLFDVSHMGQLRLTEKRPGAAVAWLERLTPSDIGGLADGQARYTVLTNEAGGVVDDLIITRMGEGFRLVVNGARRAAVADHFARYADPDVVVEPLDRALIALQGPAAEAVLAPHVAAPIADLDFMHAVETTAFGVDAMVSRCGYTGEDGFEVSLPNEAAAGAWAALVGDERVSPVGLGARDTLRLEAGLCLYGQDLNEEISPIEAALLWIIPKRRRGEGGFLGDQRILKEIAEGPQKLRVGLAVEGRVPVRAGAPIEIDGAPAGTVSSGGVGPTVGAPIAMGFIDREHAAIGTRLAAIVRGKGVDISVAKLPFLASRTKRKGK
ncbi:glycine cleavage system aminomethyltransferase GcvT [Acuticoccus kandeliae]|uniref:glycine cleavage system aminomethyltransferase GcvT n=1 Tax=Acuticoccus kandeliae TaxID=2073160 RepID=UPI001FE874D8|nr:glycine cleavage system aminomethyltransferase GcvT [Acuticoccus kandeliae]